MVLPSPSSSGYSSSRVLYVLNQPLFVRGYVFQVIGSYHWLYWVPSPLDLDSDVGKFSEERALTHVRVLSEEIGFRQVGRLSDESLKVC